MKKSLFRALLPLLLIVALLFSSCEGLLSLGERTTEQATEPISLSAIPPFGEKAYVEINGNEPFFTDEEKARAVSSFETYSELDSLKRCGVATASVGKDLMPSEDRGSIGSVKPSGWQTVKYDIVDGGYLYNRCHLIGYQLTGENANKQNLITGTRYLNIDGMLSFENMVADYVKETGNHVLYRVTPIFNGSDLVALGVLMEGWSVEDDGDGVCFCVFSYNVQPGIVINYADGTSRLAGEDETLMTMWTVAPTDQTPAAETTADLTEETSAATDSVASSSESDSDTPSPETDLSSVSSISIELVHVTDPVKVGTQARVEIKGKAGTEYFIRVTLPSGTVSSSAALSPQTADQNGMVVWEWNITKNTKPGTANVEISDSMTGFAITFQITADDPA